MAVTTEIAPNIYRISIFAERGNLQFNYFLVKDDEPLLFHTGLRGMHAEIREAVCNLRQYLCHLPARLSVLLRPTRIHERNAGQSVARSSR